MKIKVKSLASANRWRKASSAVVGCTFSKKFMVKYGIPTAAYASFTDEKSALAYIAQEYAAGRGVVVKADGLACKEDGVHFNSVSYRELGERYFRAYRRLAKE